MLKFFAEKMWVAFALQKLLSAKATHIFSAKNIRILYIESTKTVNEMTLNEHVKLTMLWTTGPWSLNSNPTICFKSSHFWPTLNGLIMLCMVGKNFSRWRFEIFFSYFPQKKDWHFLETVCMKWQSQFSGKNNKNINLSSAELSKRVVVKAVSCVFQ